ncbi:hypothetical protein N2W54_001764 [Lotmaria passim]
MKVFQNLTGNSAEDEQSSKHHARRYRVYFIILAVWVAFLVILVTILTPMLVLQHEDADTEKSYRAIENRLANDFTTQFRDAVLNAISAVYGIQGYIMGEMTTLPNLKAPKLERVKGQYFPTFDRYAKLVNSSAANIAVFLTAPGGVTYQFYPEAYGTELSNWDLLDEASYGPEGNWSDPASQRPTPWTSIRTGKLCISGPYNTSSLPFVENNTKKPHNPHDLIPNNAWWIDLRQPVYKATADATTSEENFWGFAMAALSVDNLLRDNKFEETMRANSMNYTVFTYTSSKDCIVIVSSWSGVHDCTVPFMHGFIDSATVHEVLGDQLAWKVAVKSALRENRLTPNVRLAIVLSSVLGTLVLFGLVVYVIVLCTRVYDGTVHAPKLAPFAMLTVGPCRGEELWELASDQMVEVTDRLGKVLARQMVRHHAYQIQQVHPLTTSYVTRGVAAAVQMAFDTIEELQSSPIDEPLRRLLGDDGRLLLSYAVHWCNDAVVRSEHPMEDGYRYEGPDVVYGGRMWVFAAPNVVTVSPAALPAARRMSHVRAKLFDSVFLRGVTERQDLYVVWDSTNHKLREAEDFAAEQVRRARLAQREMAEMKGSDADPTKRRLTYSFNQNGYDSSDLDIGSFSGRPRMSGCSGEAAAAVVARASSTSNTNSNSNSNSDRSTPVSAMRSRASATKTTKRDGVAGITAATSMSIIVPTLSMDAPRPSTSVIGPVGAAANPLVFPAVPVKKQERWMVRPPSGCSSSSSSVVVTGNNNNNNSGCSGDAPPHIVTNENNKDTQHDSKTSPCSSGHFDEDALCAGKKTAEVFVEGCAVAEASLHEPCQQQRPTQTARLKSLLHGGAYAAPLPALPPIQSSPRPVLTATATVAGTAAAAAQPSVDALPLPSMSSRRVLDTLYSGASGAVAAVATSTSTTATATTTSTVTTANVNATLGGGQRYSEVVVPPSAELAAAACGGHSVSAMSSSATSSSDVVAHGRRTTTGPASSYDNPLAHNLAADSGSVGAVVAGASVDGCNANGAAPVSLVAAASYASDKDPLTNSQVSLDTFSSGLLLRPDITVQADHLLRTVFDRQAVALDISYDSVRVLVYYFYSSYKILFRPLAAPERHNIYRRLVTAFGVPQQGILEHLAARCAIRFLQRHEETQTLMWDQQRRLQVCARNTSVPTTASASASDEAGNSSST